MNVLNHEIAPEFEAILAKVEQDAAIRAVVLVSGKPDNFIAGADIKMLVRAARKPLRPPTPPAPPPCSVPSGCLQERGGVRG